MKKTHALHLIAFTSLAIVSLADTHPSYAASKIFTEAVNNYSACNGPSLSNSIADVNGFKLGELPIAPR